MTPRLFGITGWKNAGKTTLVERLIAEFTRRGLTVATLKHAHHGFEPDHPGKDSHRHRVAGARQVLVASATRWALMTEHAGPEPPLASLLARLDPVDLVLIEGWKRDGHDKIEVWRSALGQPPIAAGGDPTIRAIAADGPVTGRGLDRADLPWLDLNDPARIADFVLARTVRA